MTDDVHNIEPDGEMDRDPLAESDQSEAPALDEPAADGPDSADDAPGTPDQDGEGTESESDPDAGEQPEEDSAESEDEPVRKRRVRPDEETRRIIEALLFATEQPVSGKRIAQICGALNARHVRRMIEELQAEYDEQKRSFQIEEIADGYQMLTRPQYRRWVLGLRRTSAEPRLSQAAVETLAIVAYKQPMLRAEVEAIRGVQSGQLLRNLMERGLVKIVGRADALGRPLLYGTTRRFLEYFGLKGLKDLPTIEEIQKS